MAGGLKDSSNLFGVTAEQRGSRAGKQGLRIESPPRALGNGYVDLYFVGTDDSLLFTPHPSLAVDLRPPLSSKALWRFVVETDIPETDMA